MADTWPKDATSVPRWLEDETRLRERWRRAGAGAPPGQAVAPPAAFDVLQSVAITGRLVGPPEERDVPLGTTGVAPYRSPMWADLDVARAASLGWWFYTVWVETSATWQVHLASSLRIEAGAAPWQGRGPDVELSRRTRAGRRAFRPPGSAWIDLFTYDPSGTHSDVHRRRAARWSARREATFWGPSQIDLYRPGSDHGGTWLQDAYGATIAHARVTPTLCFERSAHVALQRT